MSRPDNLYVNFCGEQILVADVAEVSLRTRGKLSISIRERAWDEYDYTQFIVPLGRNKQIFRALKPANLLGDDYAQVYDVLEQKLKAGEEITNRPGRIEHSRQIITWFLNSVGYKCDVLT